MRELFILGKNKEFLNIIGMSFKDKLFHFKLRQGWIISNTKSIKILESSEDYCPKELSKLKQINRNLLAEIENLKFSTKLDNQTPLLDTFEYQEYFNPNKSDWDLLNEINQRNPKLFAEFAKEFYKGQNTLVAIKYLKEIAEDHQLILSQNIID